MMRIRFFQIVACMVLTGCSAIWSVSQNDGQLVEMSDWPFLTIQSPSTFHERIVRNDGSVALTTYQTNTMKRLLSDFSVQLYPPLPGSCNNLGVSKPIVNHDRINETIMWGKVDFRSAKWPEDPDMTMPEERYGVPCTPLPPATAAYVLCSEKDGKRVLICISQVTNNPDLAEQIFKTFRWTE